MRDWRRYLRLLFSCIAILFFWEAGVRLLNIPNYVLPGPVVVVQEIFQNFDELMRNLRVTLVEIVFGYLIGAAMAVLTSILVLRSKVAESIIMPIVLGLQATPKLALAPLLVVWFGYGILPKILIVSLVCLFPILINTLAGLKSVDSRMLELMHVYNASWSQAFWKVRFYSAMPGFFAGLKIAIMLATVGAVVGEWVGASKGLGHLILKSNSQLNTELVFGCVLILGCLGSSLFFVVKCIERQVLYWHESTNETILES